MVWETEDERGSEKEEKEMSEVKEIYNSLLKKGLDPKDAAKIAQEQTGFSVVTGQPIRQQLYDKFGKKPPHKVIGQYGS